MNNRLMNAIMFAAGALVGSVVTYKVVKTTYERLANEEIDEMREYYLDKLAETEEEPDILFPQDVEVEPVSEKPSLMQMAALLRDQGYVIDEKTEKGGSDDMRDNGPKVISPEEFGDEVDYDVYSYTYYADGVLADEYDEIIEDVEEVVGNALDHFGEYEDDSVFVLDESRQAYIEILRDLSNYREDEAQVDE